VDYIQLMQFDNDNRVAGIGDISRGLKLIAGELKCAVVALSQLNRKCEDRADPRPVLSDLRDSGAIEQDADIVVMVYNQTVNKSGKYGELIVRKNRAGKIGTAATIWRGDHVRFEDTGDEPTEYPKEDREDKQYGRKYK
jgi:replicative DNA helicase